ncbi:hypothetical protein Q4S45_13095 [Massilia sp. R2A-15]|uniref:hypothetical protein n=1 Tax=Massilia sp. R2A-15 TaxID=3064278 RepID=UPI0027336E80|nr:hypothetical protein [Massilia sp. R2A-15]WLI87677.1 hypothetical protein Q4S45_13095 [Massilia sp. R2A-15]
MLSTAARRAIVSAFLSLASCSALADEVLPRVLQEPVFGLRFEIAKAKLDELPDEVLKLCAGLSNAQEQMRLWKYAVAHDAARTYYVVGGYYIRPDSKQIGSPRYVLDTLGAVFYIQGRECTLTGPARETFDARFFEETPQPVLQQLAADLAQRLARAFGGPDQLATQFRHQHIDSATLSPELRKAFQRYFKE